MTIKRGPAAAGSIVAEGLTKIFYTTARRPGRFSALRSLVHPLRVAKTAVADVSFRIEPGELVAFLGPNGAGKSTTIKMLTGILTPSSGRVEVNGLVPHRERTRRPPPRRRGLRPALAAVVAPAGPRLARRAGRHPRRRPRAVPGPGRRLRPDPGAVGLLGHPRPAALPRPA